MPDGQSNSKLRVLQVTRDYPAPSGSLRVLDAISFDLESSETLAITGPSGSGKTTLLSIIGSLETPTSGEVVLDGVAVHLLRDPDLQRFRAKSVGFVFQEHRLLPQLTAMENVLVPTLAPGCRDNQRHGPQLLDRVGLAAKADAFAWQLSGGERQRVAIARSLVNQPRLLLCDEPTGNLDRDNALAIADLLLGIAKSLNKAVVIVTHNQELAARCDRQLRLIGGKIDLAG